MLFLCFPFILYSQFLNVSTNLYNTVHYVRAIEILHFWQLLINVFLVIFDGGFILKNNLIDYIFLALKKQPVKRTITKKQ